MARSPVTNVINAFNALTENEKKLCLDFIAPEPEPGPQVKQTRKKRTRTPRTGLPEAAKDAKVNETQSSVQLCKALVPGLGVECAEPEENLIHDKNAGYAAYHPFSLTAPVAEKKSRRRGAAASSTANSETGSDPAMSAGTD